MDQMRSATDKDLSPAEGAEVPGEVEQVVDLEQADKGEMGDLPVEDWDYQRPRRGQLRTGVILAIQAQQIIVDVGAKRDGIVPFGDMQRIGDEAVAALSVGDKVPAYILQPEDRDGNLLVSLYLARQEQAWVRAKELADSGEVWEGPVIGYNKGGLVVPLDDIRGFVPASQVPGLPRGLDQEERITRMAQMVGETLWVKVLEINRRKRRLILSATVAERQVRQEHRQRLLDDLREGEVRRGRVSSLCPFGAFVDLGGADGLIHLSELSWRRVRHPKEVLSVGEEVDVYVLRLDRDRKRIALSLKRLQPEPWAVLEDRYELGQLIQGVVTNVADFGAFVEIEEGVEGLIHISELTDQPITNPRDVVRRGDLLLLRIIRIDPRRKRLGLSLKRVLESEWAEWAARMEMEQAGKPTRGREPQPARDEERPGAEAEPGEWAGAEAPEAEAEAPDLSTPMPEEPEAAVEELVTPTPEEASPESSEQVQEPLPPAENEGETAKVTEVVTA